MIFVKKSAGTEVEGFTGDGYVIGVHDAMDETNPHPLGDEDALVVADGFEEREVAFSALVLGAFLVVTVDDVVGESSERCGIAACGKVFEGTDPDVTLCDAGEDGSRKRCLARDTIAGGYCGKGASGRKA